MVLIGLDKLVKGVGLVLLGIGLHYFLSPSAAGSEESSIL